MAFHEVRFPDNISLGSRGGPGFSTSIVEGDGGGSERVSRWSVARHTYNARYGIRHVNDLNAVLGFYRARMGPAIGFRFKDWLDFTTASNNRDNPTNADCDLGVGTGAQTVFQLRKKYVSGPTTVYRTIEKPVLGSVVAAVNGVNTTAFSVDTTTGLITFTVAPGVGLTVTAGCAFDVPVQFGKEIDAEFHASIDDFESGDIPDIPIVEMVGNVSAPERFFYGGGTAVTSVANAQYSLSFAEGRTFAYINNAAVTILLPDPTDLELGGPYFHILNVGSGAMTLKTFDGATTIATLSGGSISSPKGATMLVYNDGTTNKWAAASN